AGVAVLQALWEVCGGLPLKIKWPNDILLNGKKLCGISCEKIFVGGKQIIVLGIGLNVNNIDFPGELAETATSLRLATGRDWDLEGILYEIIHEIHMHINHLPKEQVLKVIQQNCINLGKHVRIINEGGLVAEGIATHIDADGGIVIITKDDTPQKYHSGEISLR
ncbi:MAG: biotin--[acetyl-CoA-carboxylase] ligase, partial [Defluviitaleaceae bacterium]|nr:biotin--[acetyl-CoA-carboxylase] ligase [Defluviitaleaceae bacterium]